MIDFYMDGLMVATVGGVIAVGFATLLGVVCLVDGSGDTKFGARMVLAAPPLTALAVFAWPLVVIVGVTAGLIALLRAADLPRPHLPKRSRRRLSDADYIARLERELEMDR